jgi:hypothetical protein
MRNIDKIVIAICGSLVILALLIQLTFVSLYAVNKHQKLTNYSRAMLGIKW